MKLYNTLSRKEEEFAPINGNEVKIYSCGPTVYYTAHIGNLRAYIVGDILKKTLRLNGYEINDVMNITDVGHLVSDGDEGEDKVEKSAKAQGTTPEEIAKKYTNIFLEDMKRLNIELAKKVVPATELVRAMIKFVSGLEEKGYTYKTSDGIYFDASKFPNYFRLSGGKLEGNKGGARVDLGEKKNINDFALWKFVSPNTIQKWDSPWGVGCPGWHIECSTIIKETLGAGTIDIHTGGVDHIPVHHTNEIAQTESITGEKMANFWLHNEFVMVDGGKMSKSIGNVYTLNDLDLLGFSPMHFRYYSLLTTYRNVMNFTFDGITAAKNAYEGIVSALSKVPQAEFNFNKELLAEFKDALNDDLNTPRAIAVIFKALKEPETAFATIMKFDEVLSLGFKKAVEAELNKNDGDIPANVLDLAEARLQAKRDKDFALADKLRAEIEALGYKIKDKKDGFEITRKGD
ncbi:MAG: cysteine--tRNA ligase [Christensenellaceae bacterium]|jgi:cysteinyl-tRNA synthetase|nr:cysteine--tRNA ligase [Christensenellaceae bacterium]